jgi:hypothetical protein
LSGEAHLVGGPLRLACLAGEGGGKTKSRSRSFGCEDHDEAVFFSAQDDRVGGCVEKEQATASANAGHSAAKITMGRVLLRSG